MKKLCFSLLLLALITFFYKDILRGYADFLIVNSASKGADAILVLGGNNETRVIKAVQLYKNRYSSKIYLTQPKPEQSIYKFIPSEEEIAKQILKHYSVPFETIKSSKGGATSTIDEVYDFANFLKKESLKRVIVVTDSYHTRRSQYAFRKILISENIDTEIEFSPSYSEKYTIQNWWESEQGLLDFIPEFFKGVIYIFKLWNL
jgi:uncharacterized SAM-binding protein YcdF (DUF218 family)